MTQDNRRDASASRTDRHRASARPILSSLMVGLIAGGCAVRGADDTSLRATPPPPEGKRLAELARAAFVTAKLTGTPEVSAVHATHDAQWGDWMFCIKGDGAVDAPKYGVLIGHDAILEVRSLVMIDGCDRETYHPVEPADQKGKSDGKPRARAK